MSTARQRWTMILGGLFLLALFALGARLLPVLFPVPAADAPRVQQRVQTRQQLDEENQKKLHSYAVLDEAKGSLQIPIDRAMTLTVQELNEHKPRPAGPVATPAPTATPTPSPSPEA